MLDDLTKTFFDTFEIEKTKFNFVCDVKECSHKKNIGIFACSSCQEKSKKEIWDYPIITDTHYLELMCIFSDYINTTKKDIQELKNYILEEFITNQAGFSDEELIKIQALFKEYK